MYYVNNKRTCTRACTMHMYMYVCRIHVHANVYRWRMPSASAASSSSSRRRWRSSTPEARAYRTTAGAVSSENGTTLLTTIWWACLVTCTCRCTFIFNCYNSNSKNVVEWSRVMKAINVGCTLRLNFSVTSYFAWDNSFCCSLLTARLAQLICLRRSR